MFKETNVTYTAGKNRSIHLNKDTALWVARMLMGEGWRGIKGAAVLWATINAYLLKPHRNFDYQHYIRAFSQPINSGWLPGGHQYEQAKIKGWKDAISPARIRNRKRIRALKWDDMPEGVKNLVNKFAAGKLKYPKIFSDLEQSRVSNFASMPHLPEKYPHGVGIKAGKRTEWFFEDFYLKPGNVKTIIDEKMKLKKKPNRPSGSPGSPIVSDNKKITQKEIHAFMTDLLAQWRPENDS